MLEAGLVAEVAEGTANSRPLPWAVIAYDKSSPESSKILRFDVVPQVLARMIQRLQTVPKASSGAPSLQSKSS